MGDRKTPLEHLELFSEEEDEGEATVIAQMTGPPQLVRQENRSAFLIVLAGENVGAIYKLKSRETLIGRSESCQITLRENGISRKHARLTLRGDSEVLLEDLQSTNGTYVGEEKITSKVLRDGDRFQLGCTTLLKFSVSDEVEEAFQRRLYESSVRDGLTGLHNRKHFDERLEAEFGYAARHDAPLSVLMIDIDHFKRVNDNLGHQAGDEVLRRLARFLQENIRAEDLLARYGGEEFVIIARGILASDALVFASRLCKLVEGLSIEWSGRPVPITMSVGVATHTRGLFRDGSELVAAADRALLEAKELGRNRVVLAAECQEIL